ncbi:uncharacterized protein LOC121764390 [Salvia splendens]|uniref:uncharacterized protein LOC121764390 n=1 Tax=Salvia splendens TaxID=180675 RepID=UPI001C272364|nr:uncharacterized protein LOC121764390 [Salvia splendens]
MEMEQEHFQEAEQEQGPRASLSLSSQEKNLIVQFLQQQCRAGALPHGSFQEAAKKFKVHARTASHLWRIAKQQVENGEPVVMTGKASGYSKKKGKVILDEDKFRHLSLLERSSIRNLILRWKLASPQLPTIAEGKLLYHAMHNTVHIDEKWFYMTKASDRYYLLPDEGEPYRSCIFPFTQQVPAKRKSKNRPRGTLETKPILSVNKEAMRECLLNQPTSQLPRHQCIGPWLFRAIQSLQDDKLATNIDELLGNVWSSFEELTPQTINNVFLTLQSYFSKILEVHGSNNYKIPHLNKDRLSKTVRLPTSLEVEENLVRESLEYLLLPENDVGASYDIVHLSNVLGF